MFSHTAKGQPYNLPLLSRFATGQTPDVAPASRLIDYELLTDGPGREAKRVVGFGWFAGGSSGRAYFILSYYAADVDSYAAAGVVEGLSASALDFLSMGVASPFLASFLKLLHGASRITLFSLNSTSPAHTPTEPSTKCVPPSAQ